MPEVNFNDAVLLTDASDAPPLWIAVGALTAM